MKLISCVLALFLMTGCVSQVVHESVERNALRTDRMVQLMDQGLTTREQEKEFIRANRAAFHSLNYYLNDKPLPEDLKHLMEDK